ncbi:MAG: hypothetical protein IV089_07440 [Thiobacillus sp.]|nr:hypothetical protein [Thiobacillus sp.]
MAATICKIRLPAFFHTRRKLQTCNGLKSGFNHCFDWDFQNTEKPGIRLSSHSTEAELYFVRLRPTHTVTRR